MICPKCKTEQEDFTFSAKVEIFGVYQKDYVNGDDWDERNRGDWENIILECRDCGSSFKFEELKQNENKNN